MNKYNNGKIYKLICNNTGLVYYGSTCQELHKRKYEHKQLYKNYINDPIKYKLMTSSKIIENSNYDIILVEEYSCENRKQLEMRERFYIENNMCVNKVIPTRTTKEWHKKWYQDNKIEKLKKNKEYDNIYREKFKDKIEEYKQEYKDRIKEYQDKIKYYKKEYQDKIKMLRKKV